MPAGLDTQPGELYCPTCEQTFSRGDRCPTDNTRLVKIASTNDRLLGRELDGRYTIVEAIGHGGMGTVYRGTQHSVGREVAIKVVSPSLVSNPGVIKRFLREAKLASRLAHPNAVSVLDFGQTDDELFYLVMELVAGRTLDRVIASDGPLPPLRVVRIGTQICDALEGAHELKIVHRDLKPQNIMVMTTGRDLVKVLDFGLAKSLTPDNSTATMTNAGALLGTPAFMPPELVTGGECDARADLYSLGCVLYVAATGRPPFSANTVHELIAMHASDPMPPIVGWPRRLVAVIEKLLAKEPARRYPTAAAAREALESALITETSTPVPDEPPHSGTSTVLGWTGLPSARPAQSRTSTVHGTGLHRAAQPRAQTPSTQQQPRVQTPSTQQSRVQTPPAGVPRVQTPSTPQPRVPTPPAGVPRAQAPSTPQTPPAGMPRLELPSVTFVQTPRTLQTPSSGVPAYRPSTPSGGVPHLNRAPLASHAVAPLAPTTTMEPLPTPRPPPVRMSTRKNVMLVAGAVILVVGGAIAAFLITASNRGAETSVQPSAPAPTAAPLAAPPAPTAAPMPTPTVPTPPPPAPASAAPAATLTTPPAPASAAPAATPTTPPAPASAAPAATPTTPAPVRRPAPRASVRPAPRPPAAGSAEPAPSVPAPSDPTASDPVTDPVADPPPGDGEPPPRKP